MDKGNNYIGKNEKGDNKILPEWTIIFFSFLVEKLKISGLVK